MLLNLIGTGAIFSFVLPYVFYVNVEASLNEIESGNPAVIRQHTQKLQYFKPLINVDRLASESCQVEDGKTRAEITNAVYDLSGMNVDEINRRYCYDW